jgi:hypothetical protein
MAAAAGCRDTGMSAWRMTPGRAARAAMTGAHHIAA